MFISTSILTTGFFRPTDNRLLSELFAAVRQYPCLYDPSDPLYEDQQCREHVWRQLAVEFQMPGMP